MNNIFEALQQISDKAWSERTVDEFAVGDLVRNVVKLDNGGVRVLEGRVAQTDGDRLLSEAGITLGTDRSHQLYGAADAPRLNTYTDHWETFTEADNNKIRNRLVRKVFAMHDGTLEAIFDVAWRERFSALDNKNGRTIVSGTERSARNVTVDYVPEPEQGSTV